MLLPIQETEKNQYLSTQGAASIVSTIMLTHATVTYLVALSNIG